MRGVENAAQRRVDWRLAESRSGVGVMGEYADEAIDRMLFGHSRRTYQRRLAGIGLRNATTAAAPMFTGRKTRMAIGGFTKRANVSSRVIAKCCIPVRKLNLMISMWLSDGATVLRDVSHDVQRPELFARQAQVRRAADVEHEARRVPTPA